MALCLHCCVLLIYTSTKTSSRLRLNWLLLCGCNHTLDKEHPQFTYGLPEEHLRTITKEQRSWWWSFFSSAKPLCIEWDSGSSVDFFHVLKGPGELCSTAGKPHFYLLLSCSTTFNYRPTSVCFCHC